MHRLGPSPIIKRSIVCGGHKTSVSLENEFWQLFKEMARARDMSLSELFAEFDQTRPEDCTMSSHIRTSILNAVIERNMAK